MGLVQNEVPWEEWEWSEELEVLTLEHFALGKNSIKVRDGNRDFLCFAEIKLKKVLDTIQIIYYI